MRTRLCSHPARAANCCAYIACPPQEGEPEVLAIPAPDTRERFTCPKILPSGSSVLFDALGPQKKFQVRTLSLETGQWRTVVEDAMNPYYVDTGHLLYEDVSGKNPSLTDYEWITSLVAAPFDLASMEVTGEPVPILDGVRGVDFVASHEGTLVYVPGASSQKTLVWVDRDGTEHPATTDVRNYWAFKISPDGTRVATTVVDDRRTRNVWIYDLEEDWIRRLTLDGEQNVSPIWTPDGEWVVFSSDRDGPSNLYRQRVDGGEPAERLTTTERSQRAGSFSPDGRVLVFSERMETLGVDIGVLDMSSDGEPRPFITSPGPNFFPVFSPDGHWLAYSSLKTNGTYGVYVSPYPAADVKWLVSGEEDGVWAVWSPDGTEIFYRSGDKMMVVPVRTRPRFEAGKPRVLFEGFPLRGYDISPDGQRFLMMKQRGGDFKGQIHVVLNWSEELRR